MEYDEILFYVGRGDLMPKSVLTVFSTFCFLLITARLVYNVYFHPLARYPGPLYLTASDIPLAVLSLLGTSQYPLKAAHDRYGDIVRIAPGTLSYIKPQAWAEIYGYKKNGGGIANFPKDPAFYNEMMLGKETITLANDKDAIPIRRSLNSAFAHRSLLEQEPMLQAHIGRLMAQFEKHSLGGRPVDVREWFTFSMFDINSDFGFGEDMGCVRTGVYHDWVKQAEKEQLPTEVIQAQATVVILAGSETSSVAETAAVYHLLTHPSIYEKLEAEIRTAFESLEDITLQGVLSKLPYLDAVVQETLRIHAPLANGFTRWVPDRNGALICGKHVPQGTVVTINHYCSNTSASNFRDPFSFIPERWMGDTAYADDKRDVVQPFSVGPRNCPGQQFALYNIKLTLAHLLWRFDLKLGDGTENWAVGQRIYNGWIQPPLPIVMHKRDRP